MGNKFKFTTEFQYDLLKYTLIDSNGYKALEMYDDSYFTLLEHSVIAFTLKNYYKVKRVIPGKTIFKQELLKAFEHRLFIDSLTPDDRKEIISIVNSLFEGRVQDGDEILANVEKFAQFVDLKDVIEKVNLLDYNEYEPFAQKVQKAISPRLQKLSERGSFLSKDVVDRQIRRQDVNPIVPTPFREMNKLTNADGYVKGSILVLLDKAKKFKTGMLVNIAKGYYKRGKNVLVVDLDNGEDEFMIRVEQSITGHTKREILSGDFDEQITKKLANKKHEIIIKKFPSLITNANHIGNYITYLYREHGIKIQILVVDYIAKMASISGKEAMYERISEAYIDIDNLALKHQIEHVWTAQHVTRSAAKARMATRYDSTDIAGAIDISRHVQAIYGLNRSIGEEKRGYQRLEIVDQRDGAPRGRVIFKVDLATQIARPLKSKELEEYKNEFYEHIERVDNTEVDDDNQGKPRKAAGYDSSRNNIKRDL